MWYKYPLKIKGYLGGSSKYRIVGTNLVKKKNGKLVERRFICNKCNKCYKYRKDLIIHVEINHENKIQSLELLCRQIIAENCKDININSLPLPTPIKEDIINKAVYDEY